MKTVRYAAFGVLMAGILFMSGLSAPHADGQPPTPRPPVPVPVPETRSMAPFFGGPNYIQRGADYIQDGSVHLAQQYAKATKEEEKKDIRKKLADSLNKEFDQLAQRQQAELDELEKQVASLKAVLKKRKDSKETIVDRRLEQLIQEAEGLGWGSPNRPHFGGANTGNGGFGGGAVPSTTPNILPPGPDLPRP
jgi:hypothetical protein